MTDLLREGSALFVAWCVGLTLTYGFVESSFPGFVGWRIAISTMGEPAWWGERLVYCPYCMGFWIQGMTWWAFDWTDPVRFVWGAAVGTTVMLVTRAATGASLVMDNQYALEEDIRMEIRVKSKKDGAT